MTDGNEIIAKWAELNEAIKQAREIEQKLQEEARKTIELLEYRYIEGTNKKYAVTKDGFVISFVGKYPKVLRPKWDKHGYAHYSLSINGESNKDCTGHRLVAEAYVFKPLNPNKTLIVNHIDENPSNNHADNLEWVTYSENALAGTVQERKAITTDMNKLTKIKRISIHPNSMSKLDEDLKVWWE